MEKLCSLAKYAGTLSASPPAFWCQPSLMFFRLLSSFQVNNHQNIYSIKQFETGQKSVSTSFRVCAAPKSWSKYKTLREFTFK